MATTLSGPREQTERTELVRNLYREAVREGSKALYHRAGFTAAAMDLSDAERQTIERDRRIAANLLGIRGKGSQSIPEVAREVEAAARAAVAGHVTADAAEAALEQAIRRGRISEHGTAAACCRGLIAKARRHEAAKRAVEAVPTAPVERPSDAAWGGPMPATRRPADY